MADAPLLPHDRGHELWTMEDGASRKLIGSIDRWVSAMVGDDGIDMPLSGAGPSIEATVFARQDGLVVGCAVVDYIPSNLGAIGACFVVCRRRQARVIR